MYFEPKEKYLFDVEVYATRHYWLMEGLKYGLIAAIFAGLLFL